MKIVTICHLYTLIRKSSRPKCRIGYSISVAVMVTLTVTLRVEQMSWNQHLIFLFRFALFYNFIG